MLDVRRMKVLREVAQRGSFSAAAEALSFTQSAVSQQIAALEREAGAVARRAQRARRPAHRRRADALVRHTDAILARLAEAEAELEAIAGLRGGRLRMAVLRVGRRDAHAAGDRHVPQRHPAVELSLVARRARRRDRAPAHSGELELALRFDADAVATPDDGSIELVHLLDDPLYLALPPDHPLAASATSGSPTSPTTPWIEGTPSCACSAMLRRACQARGLRAAHRVRVRRLRGDPGLRGGGRRRRADRRARARRPCATTSSSARSGARRRSAASTPRCSRAATARRPPTAMLEILRTSPRLPPAPPRARPRGLTRAVPAHRLAGFGTTIFTEMSALAERTGSINLGQGFPDEDGPAAVIEAAVAALHAGHNQYAPLPGVPALREAIADHQRRRYGLEHDPDTEVQVTLRRDRGDRRRAARALRPGRRGRRARPVLRLLRARAPRWPARACVGVPLQPPDWRFDPAELAAAVTRAHARAAAQHAAQPDRPRARPRASSRRSPRSAASTT